MLGHTGHASKVSRQNSAYPVDRSAEVAQLVHCTCTHMLMHSACHMLVHWQLHACMLCIMPQTGAPETDMSVMQFEHVAGCTTCLQSR